ncbi:MAG: hypothetical protein HOY71_27440 [Nonomuraea sp.]|nr:hypothetical protein [Nonomuraea sp.]
MNAKLNVVVQTLAILVFLGLRALSLGWLAVIFIITVVGPAVLLVHLITALVAARRDRLPALASWGYGLTAFFLLLVGLLLPDFGDSNGGWVPLAVVTGIGGEMGHLDNPALVDTFSTVGMVGILGYVVALVVAWAGLLANRR